MASLKGQGGNTEARSLRELRRFCHCINPDKVFSTHRHRSPFRLGARRCAERLGSVAYDRFPPVMRAGAPDGVDHALIEHRVFKREHRDVFPARSPRAQRPRPRAGTAACRDIERPSPPHASRYELDAGLVVDRRIKRCMQLDESGLAVKQHELAPPHLGAAIEAQVEIAEIGLDAALTLSENAT